MNKIYLSRQRLFSSLMILSILFILVGCAGLDNETPTDSTVEGTGLPIQTSSPTEVVKTPTAQVTPIHLMVDAEDLAGIVVHFVHPWTGELAETMEQVAAAFSLSNEWDIWVEVETPGGETAMLDSLAVDLAEGDAPGLIAAYPYQLDYFDSELYSVSLSGYFDDPTWGFDETVREDIPQVFLDQFIVDGNLIALPITPQAIVLFYNQTWGEELGFSSPPANAAAFETQACDATFANLEDYDEENDGTGGWLVSFEPDVLASWYHAFGGDLAGDGTLTFDNDSSQAAFGYLKLVYDQGCFWIGRQTDPYFYFANRYTLMYAGRLDQIPTQIAWMTTAQNEDEWTVVGFPSSESEALLINGPGLMLTADTPENQMAAWLFARYLLEPDVQAEIVRSGFTLPVRDSALALLDEFGAAYPQWAQAAALVGSADPLPVSDAWGVGQWVLQDAINQFMHLDIPLDSTIEAELSPILEQLDATIVELAGMDQ